MTTSKNDTTCRICGGTGFVDKIKCIFCKNGKSIVPGELSIVQKAMFSGSNRDDLKQLIDDIEKKEDEFEDPPCGEITEFDV